MCRQRGGKQQKMPSRARRAKGGASRSAEEEQGQGIDKLARRGQLTTGDRSRVGRSRRMATAGVRSSTTVGSTVMGRGRKGGADNVGQCRVQRGLRTGPSGVQWRVATGRHATRGARKKGHPPLGLDDPGWSIQDGAQWQGDGPLNWNIQGTWTCAPGPEHPGKAEEKEGRPLGQERSGEAGGQPQSGSAGTERKGGDDGVPATVAQGDGRLR